MLRVLPVVPVLGILLACQTFAAPLLSENFDSYAVGALDKNLTGGPNAAPNGSGNPWFGPSPPNGQVVSSDGGITPHSGSGMVRGNFAASPPDFDQNWLNAAYRFNNGNPFPGGVILDWWFYDPLGAGGAALQDYAALGFYDTAPSNTDYPNTGNLNTGVARVQRLSLGASPDQSAGFDATLYQARVAGATDGYDHGWFNTTIQRTVGWHHNRIVVGPAQVDGTNTVHFFIDGFSQPTLSHNSVSAFGYNVLELNSFFGTQTGYFDDLTFDGVTPGDATLNGTVDFADLLTMAQHYGQSGDWESGDFNNDGTVDFSDLLILVQHYGQGIQTASAPGTVTAVPEPGVPVLLEVTMTIAFSRRLRKSTASMYSVRSCFLLSRICRR